MLWNVSKQSLSTWMQEKKQHDAAKTLNNFGYSGSNQMQFSVCTDFNFFSPKLYADWNCSFSFCFQVNVLMQRCRICSQRFIYSASQKSHHSIQLCSAIMNIHVKLWIIYASASYTWTKKIGFFSFRNSVRLRWHQLQCGNFSSPYSLWRCGSKAAFFFSRGFDGTHFSCTSSSLSAVKMYIINACIQFMYGGRSARYRFTISPSLSSVRFTMWNLRDMILA